MSVPEHEGRRSADSEFEQRGPTVRDRRRIDPETYEVREPQATAAPAAAGTEEPATPVSEAEAEMIELKAALAERTSDLQRLQAEYVNYKRRVDRDRDLSRKVTIEGVLKDFLSVLDDVRSAREHDELSGGFKAVAEEIERVTSKYGLETFGEAGDPFNPHIHEALLHAHAEGIDGPTCVEILQPGYRIGDRVLRPARVAVAEPDPTAPTPAEEPLEVVEPTRRQPVTEPSSSPTEKSEEATGGSGSDEPSTNDDQL
ncbi:MAG TPA: nucleotide exchange factor GrpE [Propionibacteriaceae bacterium]|nr:nucleotide exchange factor GrpE [Propionibacteriaceae bacterium]